MVARRFVLPTLILLVCCSCNKEVHMTKTGPGGPGDAGFPSQWKIQITADGNGQCVQMAQKDGAPPTPVPTWLEIKNGDYIQWSSTNASGAGKAIFFLPSGT